MDFVKANTLANPAETRRQMSRIFVDGFYHWLTFFSKDKARLSRAFEHIFDLGRFHVALKAGEIAAICAVSDDPGKTIALNGSLLRKHLGILKGSFAHGMLHKHLVAKKYPCEIPENGLVVEFVATKPCFRGKGVARALLHHALDNVSGKTFILEVADNNTGAVKLYEKLGFVEFYRHPGPGAKSGFNFFVYMKYEKPAAAKATGS